MYNILYDNQKDETRIGGIIGAHNFLVFDKASKDFDIEIVRCEPLQHMEEAVYVQYQLRKKLLDGSFGTDLRPKKYHKIAYLPDIEQHFLESALTAINNAWHDKHGPSCKWHGIDHLERKWVIFLKGKDVYTAYPDIWNEGKPTAAADGYICDINLLKPEHEAVWYVFDDIQYGHFAWALGQLAKGVGLSCEISGCDFWSDLDDYAISAEHIKEFKGCRFEMLDDYNVPSIIISYEELYYYMDLAVKWHIKNYSSAHEYVNQLNNFLADYRKRFLKSESPEVILARVSRPGQPADKQ